MELTFERFKDVWEKNDMTPSFGCYGWSGTKGCLVGALNAEAYKNRGDASFAVNFDRVAEYLGTSREFVLGLEKGFEGWPNHNYEYEDESLTNHPDFQEGTRIGLEVRKHVLMLRLAERNEPETAEMTQGHILVNTEGITFSIASLEPLGLRETDRELVTA